MKKQSKIDNEIYIVIALLSLFGTVFLILNSIIYVKPASHFIETDISPFGLTVLYLVMKFIAPSLMLLIFWASSFRSVKEATLKNG